MKRIIVALVVLFVLVPNSVTAQTNSNAQTSLQNAFVFFEQYDFDRAVALADMVKRDFPQTPEANTAIALKTMSLAIVSLADLLEFENCITRGIGATSYLERGQYLSFAIDARKQLESDTNMLVKAAAALEYLTERPSMPLQITLAESFSVSPTDDRQSYKKWLRVQSAHMIIEETLGKDDMSELSLKAYFPGTHYQGKIIWPRNLMIICNIINMIGAYQQIINTPQLTTIATYRLSGRLAKKVISLTMNEPNSKLHQMAIERQNDAQNSIAEVSKKKR